MSSADSSGEATRAPTAASRPEKRAIAELLDERTVAELLNVEKQRIDRDNRRTAVMDKALDLADARDQRQFTFALKHAMPN